METCVWPGCEDPGVVTVKGGTYQQGTGHLEVDLPLCGLHLGEAAVGTEGLAL